MVEGRYNISWRHTEAAETALGEAQSSVSIEVACLMGSIMQMGAWMPVLPSTLNVTDLGVQEWRYSL